MVSGFRPLPMAALRELLLHRKAAQAQEIYRTHLTWLIGAQLFALGGGQDYPVPDVFALFPDPAQPHDHRTAGDICQGILHRLSHPPRKESHHG